jgi:hypothetical protein
MFGGRYPNIDRWATSRAAKRRRSGKGRAVPWASPIDPTSLGDLIGGIVMNTAVSRRLALADRVIWMGTDDCQPRRPGTITRITAHQVEVLWEGRNRQALSSRATVQPSTCETYLCGGGALLEAT